MKKILFIAFSALLLVVLLVACVDPDSIPATTTTNNSTPSSTPSSSTPAISTPSSPTPSSSSTPEQEPPVIGHDCQSTAQWQFDQYYHWRLCNEHGEPTDVSAHKIKDGYCSTCDVHFSDLDGWTLLHKFNAYDHLTLGLSYDENGALMYKDAYEYTYHENGIMASSIYHENDILRQEMRWNQYGHQTLWNEYNADGTMKESIRSDFTYDDLNRVTSQKDFLNDAPSRELYYEYIGTKHCISLHVNYSEDGTKTAVYTSHDTSANPTESMTYVNDVLTTKYEYAVFTNPAPGGMETEIVSAIRKYEYNPDGSYTLTDYTMPPDGHSVSTYDADGNLLSKLLYDKAGNLIEPPEDFDQTLCAPLYGTWEYTYTMTAADLGVTTDRDLSVEMTVQMSFDDYGLLVVHMMADKIAYYNFMVNVTVETIVQEMMAKGMERYEVFSYYLDQGTTIEAAAMKRLPSLEEILPEDTIFIYNVKDGVLHYSNSSGTFRFRVTVDGTTVTLVNEETGETRVMTKNS